MNAWNVWTLVVTGMLFAAIHDITDLEKQLDDPQWLHAVAALDRCNSQHETRKEVKNNVIQKRTIKDR